MKPTREQIARDYPHRVAADPGMCPVCCDDGITNDTRYAGKPSDRGWEGSGPWFECRACEVWHGDADGFGEQDPDELRDWTEQDERAAAEERLENIRRER